ncbi:hypothetical protein [Aminipila terrae]|nr:hypothetical protein [Aminipila terrae]
MMKENTKNKCTICGKSYNNIAYMGDIFAKIALAISVRLKYETND